MLHPVFIRGELIDHFRAHLLKYPYYKAVHKGTEALGGTIGRLSSIEVDEVMCSFENSDFPLACHLGSKSTEKFFDYHIALRYGGDKREVFVNELIVRGDQEKNIMNGIWMSFYFLSLDRYGIERMIVPFKVPGLGGVDDLKLSYINDNATLITRS